MRSLQATVCFLLAAALTSSSVIPQGWNQGQEYKYSYTSQVLTGIPQLKNQFAGVRLTSEVRVQPESESVLKIKFEEPRYQTYNQEIDLRNGKEAPHSGEDNIDPETKNFIQHPFKVYLSNGEVQKIEFEQNEPEFVVNIKKGFVSQLQLNLSNVQGLSGGSINDIQKGGSFVPEFRSWEKSVLGECETQYNIVRMPQYKVAEWESQEKIDQQQSGGWKHKHSGGHHHSVSGPQMDSSSYQQGSQQQSSSFKIIDEDMDVSVSQDVQERERLENQKKHQKKESLKSRLQQQKETLIQNEMERESRKQQQSQGQQTNGENACAGKDYFEIIKTKDLQRCKNTPDFWRTFGIHKKQDQILPYTLPIRSSVTRAIVCGSPQSFVIRKVTTENRYIKNAMGEFSSQEKLDLSSFSVINLEQVQGQQQPINGPTSPKTYDSLVYEYPARGYQSTHSLRKDALSGQSQGRTKSNMDHVHAPMPDMESAPASFLPWPVDNQQIKQQAVQQFQQLVQASQNSHQSSKKGQDVAALSVNIAEALGKLSYQELQQVEQEIKSQQGKGYTSPQMKAFYDIVSMAGSNPAVKLIIERTKSQEMRNISWEWSWIVSNVIRNVRTPTEQLLNELVQLLKHQSVQESRIMTASVALSLTDLVDRACINKVLSHLQFPVNVFGQFCDQDSEVVKRDLLQHLTSKLQQFTSSEMGQLITYIEALGNLQMEESVQELLKVVEGRRAFNPHPRSLAVYTLIKAAQLNPSQLRPIFQVLIENTSENEEVRIAAVEALLQSQPSTADLQRLAVRTWYDNSEQVSAYIVSSLHRLANLTESYQSNSMEIKSQAQQAITLARPDSGLQMSKTAQQTFTFPHMKMNANKRFQEIISKRSPLPKNLYYRANLVGESTTTSSIEHSLYQQGGRQLIAQLTELYYDLMRHGQLSQGVSGANKQEILEVIQKMQVKDDQEEKPEAYWRLNYMGLQQLYSFDNQFMEQISQWFGTEIAQYKQQLQQGINWEHRKFIEFYMAQHVFPTETGIPAYISIRNPANDYTTVFAKAKNGNNLKQGVDVEIMHIANQQNLIQVGIACPISKKVFAAGVENSVNWGIPVNAQVMVRDGQLDIKLKKSQSQSQNGQQVFQYDVQPFTSYKQITELKPLAKSSNTLEIRSTNRPQKVAYKFGKRNFGLDMTVEIESDRYLDRVQGWEDAKNLVPLLFTSPPFVKISPKKSSVTWYFNPQSSQTQEMDITLSLAAGGLQKKLQSLDQSELEQNLMVHLNGFKIEQEIERIAQENSKSSSDISSVKQKVESKKQQAASSQLVQECQKEQQWYQQQLQKIHQLQQKQQEQVSNMQEQVQAGQPQLTQEQISQLVQQRLQICQKERQICEVEEQICQESGIQSQSTCQTKKQSCKLRQRSALNVKQSLQALKYGSSASMSVKIQCTGQSQEQKRVYDLEATYGQDQSKNDFKSSKISFNYYMDRPSTNHEIHQQQAGSRRQLKFDMSVDAQEKKPSNTWDRSAIISEQLNTKVQVNAQYQYEQQQQQQMQGTIVLVQSNSQKEFAKSSSNAQKCDEDERQGKYLSQECKQARHQACALDKMDLQVQIPSEVSQNQYVQTATSALKGYLWPYVTEVSAGQGQSGSGNTQDLHVQAKVSSQGNLLGFELTQKNTGYKVQAQRIRLSNYARYVLPICTKESILSTYVQRMSNYRSPGSCVIEQSRVVTFDGVQYPYKAHECQQILLAERSQSSKIMVTLQNKPATQITKAIFDGQKYEIEVQKQSRHSRGQQATIKINGQSVNLQVGEIKQSQDQETVLTRYQDGVYSIYNRKYAVAIKVDGEYVELKASQYQLKNKVMGLCGDLNNEKTADMKSPKGCVLSKPQIAAYTYTVDIDQCQAVPSNIRQQIQQEEQQCQTETEVPTKVSALYNMLKNPIWKPSVQHLVERHQDKVCFTRSMIRTCSLSPQQPSFSSGIKEQLQPRDAVFVCVPKLVSQQWVNRAQAGESINTFMRLPASYRKTVYEPVHC